MECKYLQTIHLPPTKTGITNNVVMGEVIGIHINEDIIVDGIIDVRKIRPLARLGYLDYALIEANNIFSLDRPD